MTIKLNYQLTCYGSADSELIINGKSVKFHITYLGSPINNLLKALLSIVPGYAAVEYGSEKPDCDAKFTWQGEPWCYLWDLTLMEDKLKIKILYSGDYMGYPLDWKDSDTKAVLLDTECSLDEFARAVAITFDNLLKNHGVLGYMDGWEKNYGDDFPITELLLLKYYVLNGKAWQLAEGEKWRFDDEIGLIRQKIEPNKD